MTTDQHNTQAARWCPDVCPFTGLRFFMWIEHHMTGAMVPTYGGPYDSYTLPVRDEDGSYSRERYDHDRGGWRTDIIEDLGIQIVSDQAYVSDEPPPGHPDAQPATPPSAEAASDADMAVYRSIADPYLAAQSPSAERGGDADTDVRSILLDAVPGDGDGLEVYAKTVDDVVRKLTEMGEEIETLTEQRDEALRGPWPEWAEAIRKRVRDGSGYDGYDDADGVDLPGEVAEHLDEIEGQCQRLHDEIKAARAAQPAAPLFTASIAARKWQELQADGHRMTLIRFDGGKGGPGSIDPGGVVMWGAQPAAQQGEIERLRKALVYTAFALHATPQHMLASGISLIDGDTVEVKRDGWSVRASTNPHDRPYTTPQPAQQADGYREQHARDSAELRRVCQARDDARRERDAARAELKTAQQAREPMTDEALTKLNPYGHSKSSGTVWANGFRAAEALHLASPQAGQGGEGA